MPIKVPVSTAQIGISVIKGKANGKKIDFTKDTLEKP